MNIYTDEQRLETDASWEITIVAGLHPIRKITEV